MYTLLSLISVFRFSIRLEYPILRNAGDLGGIPRCAIARVLPRWAGRAFQVALTSSLAVWFARVNFCAWLAQISSGVPWK